MFSIFTNANILSYHNQRDNLQGSLVLVLFVAELDFPKILVSRLPQDTSNVNMESSGKSTKSALFM